MLLCLDIGNSNICGGVFNNDKLELQFRYDSSNNKVTSDQFGVFLRNVLRINGIDHTLINSIGIASVVPELDYSIRASCIKYINKNPPIFLNCDIENINIIIKTKNPNELGADFIAEAMAARYLFPNENIIIFDLGTATTCCFITKDGEYLGGGITPGVRLMMESLQQNTSKLFGVNIEKPYKSIGDTTKLAIQSGIYYAQLGLMKEMINNIIKEHKLESKPLVLATGGFCNLFVQEKIFDHIISELVLLGIKQILIK